MKKYRNESTSEDTTGIGTMWTILVGLGRGKGQETQSATLLQDIGAKTQPTFTARLGKYSLGPDAS